LKVESETVSRASEEIQNLDGESTTKGLQRCGGVEGLGERVFSSNHFGARVTVPPASIVAVGSGIPAMDGKKIMEGFPYTTPT
jgi:hypothetical protein